MYLSFMKSRFSLGWLVKGWLAVADWWAEDLSLYTPGPECEAAVSSPPLLMISALSCWNSASV